MPPLYKIWLAGFVIYFIHTLHVMNGQGLQLSCWIPKSGNCGDYKNKTCNFRHLNTEIHEGNHKLISTLLRVSSNSFAVTSASAYKLAIKVTKVTLCLKTWLIKLLQFCYLWSISGYSVPPIAFICHRFISSERSGLNISLHCYSRYKKLAMCYCRILTVCWSKVTEEFYMTKIYSHLKIKAYLFLQKSWKVSEFSQTYWVAKCFQH